MSTEDRLLAPPPALPSLTQSEKCLDLGVPEPRLEGLGSCQDPRRSPPSLVEDRLAVGASHPIHKPHS